MSILFATAIIAAAVAGPVRTDNIRPQYVPWVPYGGRPERYIASEPETYIARKYKNPPKAKLTVKAQKQMDDMNARKGRAVDWDDYNRVSACPYCPNRHAGGDCVPPIGRTETKKKR